MRCACGIAGGTEHTFIPCMLCPLCILCLSRGGILGPRGSGMELCMLGMQAFSTPVGMSCGFITYLPRVACQGRGPVDPRSTGAVPAGVQGITSCTVWLLWRSAGAPALQFLFHVGVPFIGMPGASSVVQLALHRETAVIAKPDSPPWV